MKPSRVALSLIFAMSSFAAIAADYPAPKQGEWVAQRLQVPHRRGDAGAQLHYTTVGDPRASRCWCCTAAAGSAAAC